VNLNVPATSSCYLMFNQDDSLVGESTASTKCQGNLQGETGLEMAYLIGQQCITGSQIQSDFEALVSCQPPF
jgi:hypothetical protein